MMINMISQTDWIFKTDLILGIKEALLFTALSMPDSIKTMISIPVRKTINEENKITYLNAFLRSTKEANSMSFVKNIEKITTPKVPIEAATKPLPPSNNPKASP